MKRVCALVSLLGLFAPLSLAAPTDAGSCTYNLKTGSQVKGQKCGDAGSINPKKTKVAGSGAGMTVDATPDPAVNCLQECLAQAGCIAFGLDDQRTCRLYADKIVNMGWKANTTSTTKFYNKNCYKKSCTTTPPPQCTPSPAPVQTPPTSAADGSCQPFAKELILENPSFDYKDSCNPNTPAAGWTVTGDGWSFPSSAADAFDGDYYASLNWVDNTGTEPTLSQQITFPQPNGVYELSMQLRTLSRPNQGWQCNMAIFVNGYQYMVASTGAGAPYTRFVYTSISPQGAQTGDISIKPYCRFFPFPFGPSNATFVPYQVAIDALSLKSISSNCPFKFQVQSSNPSLDGKYLKTENTFNYTSSLTVVADDAESATLYNIDTLVGLPTDPLGRLWRAYPSVQPGGNPMDTWSIRDSEIPTLSCSKTLAADGSFGCIGYGGGPMLFYICDWPQREVYRGLWYGDAPSEEIATNCNAITLKTVRQ